MPPPPQSKQNAQDLVEFNPICYFSNEQNIHSLVAQTTFKILSLQESKETNLLNGQSTIQYIIVLEK